MNTTNKTFPIVADYLAIDAARKAALLTGRCVRAAALREKMEALYSVMTAAAQRQLAKAVRS